MKRYITFGLVAAAVAAAVPATSAEAQQLRIGFINSERVLMEAPAFAAVRETLEAEFAPMRAEIEQMENTLQEQQQATAELAPEVRQQRQQAMQQQFVQYQQRVAQIEQAFQQRQAQLVEPLMTRIRDVLEQVRREGNFSFIIDPPDGLVVVSDPALDVTDQVLARLAAQGGG